MIMTTKVAPRKYQIDFSDLDPQVVAGVLVEGVHYRRVGGRPGAYEEPHLNAVAVTPILCATCSKGWQNWRLPDKRSADKKREEMTIPEGSEFLMNGEPYHNQHCKDEDWDF